jgi:hypothetical protein
LKINGVTATEFLDVPNTGGFQNWQTITASDVYIPAGVQSFEIRFLNGGFNFNSMEFIHTVTGSEGVPDVPREFRVDQNYPNPFNPITTISYSIPADGNVKIVLFDILGNKISDPINEHKSAGIHSYRLNTREYELSSGVYFVKISFKEKLTEIIKLVLMK